MEISRRISIVAKKTHTLNKIVFSVTSDFRLLTSDNIISTKKVTVELRRVLKYKRSMETPANSIESLFERAEAYGKTTYELSKLKLLETTNILVSSVIARLSVMLMISMFSFVLSIGVALWLGDVLGKSYYGFFVVAGFYMISGIVLHFFLYKWVKKPISELIIKQAPQ
jgi:hypothetical protein